MDVKRRLPLSGVAAVVLIFASFVPAGTTPAADASAGHLARFYTQHAGGQMAAGVLMSLGALLLLIFAATLADVLRGEEDEAGPFPALCFAGGVLAAVGLAIFAGLSFAIGDVVDRVDPFALQALHVLSQELFFPLTVGTAAFLLGAGVAALKTGALSSWLGWAAVVLGAMAAIPSHVLGGALDHIGFFAFIGLGIWTLVVSVLLTRSPAVRGA